MSTPLKDSDYREATLEEKKKLLANVPLLTEKLSTAPTIIDGTRVLAIIDEVAYSLGELADNVKKSSKDKI